MYGVPRYGELSPVPLTFIMFPIFFGWMFPDIGHGLLLAIIGLLMFKGGYKGKNPILSILFGGRYPEWGLMFFLMGLFATIFAIFMSGDVFGVEIYEAPLRFVVHHEHTIGIEHRNLMLILMYNLLEIP